MCILFIYMNNNGVPVQGEYKLILASNRDEYYTRPAKGAAPWDESPFVIGGRDMEPGREGGTWLAISGREGIVKIGALLNVTVQIDTKGGNNGGNVSILHTSNTPCKIDQCELDNPLGFGNSTLDVPLQKVKHGRKQFGDIVDKRLKLESKEQLINELLELLSSDEKHLPDPELSRRVPKYFEKLSSINVRFPESGYGSRTRTVILIDHENRMDFIEETMVTADPNGEWKRTTWERQF